MTTSNPEHIDMDASQEACEFNDLLTEAGDLRRGISELTIDTREESEACIKESSETRQSEEDTHKETMQRIETEYGESTSAAELERKNAIREARRIHDSAMEKIELDANTMRDRIRKKATRNVRTAKAAMEEASWVADTVFEANENRPREKFEELRELVETTSQELDALDGRISRELRRYWQPRPRTPELTDQARESASKRPEQSMLLETAKATKSFESFRQIPIAKLFRGPIMIVPAAFFAGAGVGAGHLATGRGDTSSLVQFGLIGLGVFLPVLFSLYVVARKQIRRSYEPMALAMKLARYCGEVALDEARTIRTLTEKKLEHSRDKDIKQSKDRYEPLIGESRKKAEDRLSELERRVPKLKKIAANEKDAAIKAAEAELTVTLENLKREFDVNLKTEQERHEQAVIDNERLAKERWDALEHRWFTTLSRDCARATEIQDDMRERFPEWSSPWWKNWSPASAPPPAIPMGWMTFNRKEVDGGPPTDERLETDEPAVLEFPGMICLPSRASLEIDVDAEHRDVGLDVLRSVMLRILATVPPGKARFTVMDPVGLGQNFAGFMHLEDEFPGLIGERIWTEPRHIEQKLVDITEHMETVIQKYLRNEFESIDDYNAEAGEIAEPYRFLVMADFPGNLNEQATKRLMSILRSGTRCGVYAILLRDLRRPLPQGLHETDIHDGMIVLRSSDNGWHLRNNGFEDLPIRLGEDMPDALANTILRKLRDASEATHRVEVPFDLIKPRPDEIWTGSTAREIRVALGQHGAKRTQDLRLGRGTAQHALVAGKTGSGKSTLMHVLVTNLAMWHSPDEIEFYLVDFKKGVEFQVYDTHALPHAQVIAIESDREFGLSVLQRIDDELKRRGELYRKLGVQDLEGYRAASGEPLPRVLLVVDEFQEIFVEDDMVAQEASLLLDRLVRQGRAFGMHALLGSQTLDGVYSLARSTMGQMGVRIALQCSEADSYLILAEDNPAARLLTRPGDAIYNDAGGKYEGNNPFQIVWLDEAQRDDCLKDLHHRASEQGRTHTPFVFRGHIAADLADCQPLEALLASPAADSDQSHAWLGDAVAIKPPTTVSLARRTGANLLLLGQHEESAAAILESVMLALAAQATPHGDPTFALFDGFGPTNGRLERLADALPHEHRSVKEHELEDTLVALHAELGRRLENPRSDHPPLYLFITAMQNWRALRRNEDDFSFSSDDGPPKPDAIVASILRDGPAVGMHVITWIDTVNNLSRFLDRGAQREFENRVLFQMSQMDSSQVIDSTAAGRLGSNRALLHSEDLGQVEKFRPWGLAEEAWLLQQAQRLSR